MSARWRIPVPSGASLGLGFILLLAVVLLVVKDQFENFFHLKNLQLLLHQAAVPAVVALGMLLVIISGGIDLSVGSVVALASVSAMQAYQLVLDRSGSMSLASLSAIAAGVGVGGVCGMINGLIITKFQVSPFVTTLGMFSIARGLAYWRTDKVRLFFKDREPEWVLAIGKHGSDWAVFDPGVWSVVVLAILVWVLLRYTVLGRHCYAIGSREATARLCGVNVHRRKILIYTLAGLLTGWGGVLMFAQTSSGDPNTGQGLELNVIAAVVIGGASLSGGKGTVLGTMLGVLLLTALESVLIFLSVSIELKNIVLGVVVILNTALARLQRRPG